MPLPPDHLERVYAGVIGKVVGVYLGRPFEGWPREKILSELGQVRYYVHNKAAYVLGAKSSSNPLVVTDDDVSVTFAVAQAFREHGVKALESELIGKTWLNNTVENKSMFWWGGKGISTEHTSYLNLKHGIAAPKSGSIEANGKTVAEQIGGEIFIDGFGLCAAANPDLAAQLAQAAASVSHDGESVYGAITWAVMEAEAFLSKDVDHLIDTSLKYIPKHSIIYQSTQDIRAWAKIDKNWETTRDRIEGKYGNHLYGGACHVVPNHSIKILSLVYGGHTFDEAISIIVTCGWDTDSNGGNVGTLLGIMHGLDGFETGPDWRGPLADRAIISSADGGYSINNCARIAYDFASWGRELAGEAPLQPPKKGAQYHFSLPGSVQGFRVNHDPQLQSPVSIEQAVTVRGPALSIRLEGLSIANDPVEIMTDTFMPADFLGKSHYHLMACPLVYTGQEVQAVVFADEKLPSSAEVIIALRLKHYTVGNTLKHVDGPSCSLRAGVHHTLEWTIPDTDCWPIQQLGLVVSTPNPRRVSAPVYVDSLGWTGSPNTTFGRPSQAIAWPGNEAEAWRRTWIENVAMVPWYMPYYAVSSDEREGGIFQGTQDWFDYRVTVPTLTNNTPGPNGLAVRYQGLRRWYALLFLPGQRIAIVKAKDEERKELVAESFEWTVGQKLKVALEVQGKSIRGFIDGVLVLEAEDSEWQSGGMGLLVTRGSASADKFVVEPL